MPTILIAECMQEISSFNPLPSEYENFHVERGAELYAQRGLNTAIGGALDVFEPRDGLSVVPAYGARAGSAGLLSAQGWARLSREFLDAVEARLDGVDGIYVSRCTERWALTANSTRRASSSPRSAAWPGRLSRS